jgi:hypothetical protein
MSQPAPDDSERWHCHIEGDDPYHVWPVHDIIEHDHEDPDGNCVCGPTIEPVEGHNGYIGWLITHHSLDGREQHE